VWPEQIPPNVRRTTSFRAADSATTAKRSETTMIKGSEQCKSCGAPVHWLMNTGSGRYAAIDVVPVLGGDVAIDLYAGIYSVLKSRTDRLAHTSHSATCPQVQKPR